jgi:hypothetical protein
MKFKTGDIVAVKTKYYTKYGKMQTTLLSKCTCSPNCLYWKVDNDNWIELEENKFDLVKKKQNHPHTNIFK